MDRRPLLVVLAILALAIAVPVSGVGLGLGGAGATSSPSPAVGASAPPLSTADPSASPDPSPGSSPNAGPGATPVPPAATVTAAVPIVPVTQFRSTRNGTTAREVAAVLAGESTRYDALELVAADADAILDALGLDRPADPTRLVEAPSAARLMRDLARHRTRLAFLRADEVGPGVRALAWSGQRLFGVDRVTSSDDWPLTATVRTTDPAAFDPSATWTLVAGGDIMLDRGVYDVLRNQDKGADFPFDGGTADITSLVCCSSFGWEVPRIVRTGKAGAVRDLISGADIAVANFENPAPNTFTWHTTGTRFSADETLIDGIVAAGFDVMGVANNHIRDQGGTGLRQTVKNLRERGLLTTGAGKDLTAARKPALIETHGVTVAILAYDAIAGYYHATDTSIGSAPMRIKVVRADIRAARAAGADVVIVYPHWGVEYRATAGTAQRALAHKVIDAGADMIIGNHAHWTAEMEIYQGKAIWYALGNLVFDQTWSAETMEGMTLELTFHGSDLVQVRMRPHVIVDKAQPNFLDATDGKVVLDRVYGDLLPW